MFMKPGRPFGLSLAILASAMLFSILPLMQVILIILIRYRLQNTNLAVPGAPEGVTPSVTGGSFMGITEIELLIQVGLGLLFLVIAVFAWRGRPAWIRYAMLAAVALLAALTVVLSALPLATDTDLNTGIDSGASFIQTLLSGRLILSLLVALYVVWYANRGPARAFYRGYYLPDPDETTAR
jgi:hypothetical protein